MAKLIKHLEQKSKIKILQTLRMHGSVPRTHLAKLTDLSRAAVSVAITELLESGLVQETEVLQSTGGRPPIALEINPNSHAILGADYENQEWTLGAFDLLGNILKKVVIPVDSPGPEEAIDRLTDEIGRVVSDMDIPLIPLIGLGMPGLVDTQKGVIINAPDIGWNNVDIGKLMSRKISWPTVSLNRHRARGLAECRYGSGRENSHLIYVGVGTGIAAGLFHNQMLISGALGSAGELMGHITIEIDGPLCPCGNHGCLQILATEPAIEYDFRKRVRAGTPSKLQTSPDADLQLITGEQILKAADQGDEAALAAVNKAGTYLGVAFATMVNLFNPEAIILGGSLPRTSRAYVDTALKVMRHRAMLPIASKTDFRMAAIGDIGGALGAANFALDKNMSYSMLTTTNGVSV